MNRSCSLLVLLGIASFASSHPGGGIVALDENTVLISDPMNNALWRIKKGEKPTKVLPDFHTHWLTRGADGKIYTEAFQEFGGKWSSSAFELTNGKPRELAHRDQINALSFAVDSDESLIFQRGSLLVRRSASGEIKPLRSMRKDQLSGEVRAFAWGSDGALFFADDNILKSVSLGGLVTTIDTVEGKLLQPVIWGEATKPRIWGMATDSSDQIFITVPDVGSVFRFDRNRTRHTLHKDSSGWRTMGVAVYGDSVFLLESSDRNNDGPRVRVIRPGGAYELIGQIGK